MFRRSIFRQWSHAAKLWLVFFMVPVLIFVGCTTNNSTPTADSPATTTPSAVSPAPDQSSVSAADMKLAQEIASGVVAACPVVDPGDGKARDDCANKLTNLKVLRETMSEGFLWGQQKEAGLYDLKKLHTTVFDPLVWRRLYMSTFMFPSDAKPKVEQVKDLTIIRLPIKFRHKLDMGAFPYPFWHSPNKWDAYQSAEDLLLVMNQGKLKAALRSFEKNPNAEKIKVEWDGLWQWTDTSGQAQPRVTLFKYLLSEANPHAAKLDESYRAFEVEMRQHTCFVCHSPDNANEINPLLLLNYPNQALTLRHETLRQIEENLMPPPNGVKDPAEREKLIELARNFAKAGDEALTYEGEVVKTAQAS